MRQNSGRGPYLGRNSILAFGYTEWKLFYETSRWKHLQSWVCGFGVQERGPENSHQAVDYCRWQLKPLIYVNQEESTDGDQFWKLDMENNTESQIEEELEKEISSFEMQRNHEKMLQNPKWDCLKRKLYFITDSRKE